LTDDPLAAIRAVDRSIQLDDVLALPDHLGDALWRVESARLEPFDAGGLIVCGMGGSAIGGLLAQAALGDRLSKLACFDAAEAVGAHRVVATTGGALGDAARAAGVPVIGIPAGLQPRAAVGYMFTASAEMAALAGAAPAIRTEIDSSAAHLKEALDALVRRSADLAGELEGTVPVVYGCDLTAPVAYRWKTQLNENAKLPAFAHELPEMDHNEIVGWIGADDGGTRFSAVFLEDSDQHPRERRRAELTAKLIQPAAAAVVRVETEGETRTERLLWAVMLGDLLSLQLAARRGIDPTPVEVLDRLKAELGRP
jgi:glucose/mannose-6-phosphate isomerase